MSNIVEITELKTKVERDKVIRNSYASVIKSAIKGLKGFEQLPEAKKTKTYLEQQLYKIKQGY